MDSCVFSGPFSFWDFSRCCNITWVFNRHEVGPHGKGEKEASELSLSQATERKYLSLRRGGGGLFWSPQLFENFILSNITQRCQKKKKKKAADLIFLSSFQGELSFPSKTNAHPEIYRFIWLLCSALSVYKLLEAGTGYLTEPSCWGAWLKQSTFSVLTFSTTVMFLESCVSVEFPSIKPNFKCTLSTLSGECLWRVT